MCQPWFYMDFMDLHSQFTPCGHRELLSDLKDLNLLVEKNTEVWYITIWPWILA